MTNELPVWRLNLLRIGYLLLVGGLGLVIWPSILDPATTWELKSGLVVAMLGALSPVAVLGLRYPLQMLPLLFFEMAWKTIWLLRMALPQWSAHRLDLQTTQTAVECLGVIGVFAIIPWSYVLRHYVMKTGDPWRRRATS